MLGNTVVGRYVFFEERPSRNVSISSTLEALSKKI